MQRLLNQADWDADAVHDEVRRFVLEHLGAEDGVLAVDEIGFIKKGTQSAGVQRQYTGTSGKIDNCQLGVFLAYASTRGRALVDRELYLPTSWIEDPAPGADAKISDDISFRTKPALARSMLERAVAAKVPFRWVTGDEVYGQDPVLRSCVNGNFDLPSGGQDLSPTGGQQTSPLRPRGPSGAGFSSGV